MFEVAFLDCDTQLDFMDPAGALHVPGAETIVPNVKRLIGFARARRIPLISVVDAHFENDPEFGEWPAHCVAGTQGQRKIPGTTWDDSIVIPNRPVPIELRPGAQIVIEKRIFGVFDNVNMDVVLRKLGVRRLVVFGVSTDHGVRTAALGLLERGHAVSVVTDAVKGMTSEGEIEALSELTASGAKLVTTEEILEELTGLGRSLALPGNPQGRPGDRMRDRNP